jgi:hypothetical protein
VDGFFSREILVSLLDTDAVPLAGGTAPSWRASWLPYVHFPRCAGGNPRTRWFRQQRFAPFLKVLLGTSRFGARSRVVHFRRAQRLRVAVVDPPLSPFCLFLGIFLLLPSTFFLFETRVDCIVSLLY